MGLLLRATITCRTTLATTTSSVAAASDTASTESVHETVTEDTTTTQLPVLRRYLKVPIETLLPPSFTPQPSRNAGLNARTLPTPDKRGSL